MTIAVIIRSCGRPLLLQRALESVRSQVLRPTEVVFVCIGKAGAEAVEGADLSFADVRKVQVREGIARGAALNAGIHASSADWLAILDDDDTWFPEFLSEAAAAAARLAEADDLVGVVARTEVVYERRVTNKVEVCRTEVMNPTLVTVSVDDLFEANRFTINAAVWRRSAVQELGGFREELDVLEDWEFNFRAAVHGRLHVIPVALARYHRRPPEDAQPNSLVEEHDRMAGRLRAEWRRQGVRGRPGLIEKIGVLAQLRQRWRRFRERSRWKTG